MSAVPRGRLCAMESGEHHGLERSLARSQVSNVQQPIAPSAPLRGEAQNVGPPLASDSQPADSSDLSCLAVPSRTQTRPLGLAALARRKPRAVHLSSPCLGGDPAALQTATPSHPWVWARRGGRLAGRPPPHRGPHAVSFPPLRPRCRRGQLPTLSLPHLGRHTPDSQLPRAHRWPFNQGVTCLGNPEVFPHSHFQNFKVLENSVIKQMPHSHPLKTSLNQSLSLYKNSEL